MDALGELNGAFPHPLDLHSHYVTGNNWFQRHKTTAQYNISRIERNTEFPQGIGKPGHSVNWAAHGGRPSARGYHITIF